MDVDKLLMESQANDLADMTIVDSEDVKIRSAIVESLGSISDKIRLSEEQTKDYVLHGILPEVSWFIFAVRHKDSCSGLHVIRVTIMSNFFRNLDHIHYETALEESRKIEARIDKNATFLRNNNRLITELIFSGHPDSLATDFFTKLLFTDIESSSGNPKKINKYKEKLSTVCCSMLE